MMNFVNSLLILVLLAGCRGVKFDPDFYVGFPQEQVIVSERGDIIPTSDARFQEFACMHKEKVKELKKLLMSKKIGNANHAKVRTEYAKLDKHFRGE